MNTTNATTPARTDNAVFPTPWTYQFELHSDDKENSSVVITDRTGFEFTSYEGDCEGAHEFIESAHAMEESHQLLAAAKLALAFIEKHKAALIGNECTSEAYEQAITPACHAIADAERV